MAKLCPRSRSLSLACALLLVAGSAAAQTPIESPVADPSALGALHSEVTKLREEVGALRALLVQIQDAVTGRAGVTTMPGPPAPGDHRLTDSAVVARRDARPTPLDGQAVSPIQPPPPQALPVTPEMIDLVRAQLDEQAQTKVESASRMPVKLSGTILVNTYVNSGEANWLENPDWVSSPAAGNAPRGSMSATARQSRIGLDIGGIAVGDWQASGTLIADFYGGTPGFRTGPVMGLPRLIYAFGRLENDKTAIQVGQDHVLLAPRDPTSLAAFSFPLLFRSGNLYLRAPQVRVERDLTTHWSIATGIVAPIAGDATASYEFAPQAGAGERSMRPAFQGRLGYARGDSESDREVAVGASGHYGWRRSGSVQNETWAVAVDVNARAGRVGVAGEWYAADNAEAFGGGISQPGRAVGGWAEGRFALTARTTTAAGFGVDRPKDAAGRVLRQENKTAFSSVIFQLTPEVSSSVEYRWMQTRIGQVPAENHHVNAVFAVKF